MHSFVVMLGPLHISFECPICYQVAKRPIDLELCFIKKLVASRFMRKCLMLRFIVGYVTLPIEAPTIASW